MADENDRLNEAGTPLTAEEVLLFGPCVEAQVWSPVWIQEARAPIAVAAGRPKLGPVFNSDGVGKVAVIRPCVSRGRAVRGLRPIYTPQMLEAHAGVFKGWPMFMDHLPKELAATLAKHGRSVKELGGQMLETYYRRDFTHKDDGQYGYQKGAVLGEAWATPLVRQIVGNNPNLLHTSISAWPTSGKPGVVPWRPAIKGMIIEGIRRQPQGSVDFVVRGGAGGRLLLAEGDEDEGAWPEVGEWNDDDRRFVVSLTESFYASGAMAQEGTTVTLPARPEELRDWIAEHAPHLAPALVEASTDEPDADDKPGKGKSKRKETERMSEGETPRGLTEEDVRRIMQEAQSGQPTVEEFEQRLMERTDEILEQRDAQRELSQIACALIESAEGILPTWKADLKARYTMLPSGPPAALTISESDLSGEDGATLSEQAVVEERVKRDLDRVRDLIAEARGKPRVRGEGSGRSSSSNSNSNAGTGRRRDASDSHWRRRFVEMGMAESEDKAVEAFGGKVTGD